MPRYPKLQALMEQRAAEKARVVAELAEVEAAKAAAAAAEQARRVSEAAAVAAADDNDDDAGDDFYDDAAAHNEPVDVKDIQQLLEVQRQRQRKAARQRQAQRGVARRTMLTEN